MAIKYTVLGFAAGAVLLLEYQLVGPGVGSSFLSYFALALPVVFASVAASTGSYAGIWRGMYVVMVKSGTS